MATTVACVFGDAAKSGGSRFARASGSEIGWGLWGMMGAAANSALAAERHMHEFGTTSRQLAEVAVACRKHASMNPNAVMREPITIEDHQASRLIVRPLRLLDCCLISDGGVSFIVTSTARAKDRRKKPVLVSGIGQCYTTRHLENPDWWYVPHQKAALADAFKMASATPRDIDVAQLYDNFTISVLLWLEHAGFCKRGERAASSKGDGSSSAASCPSTLRAATCPKATWRAGYILLKVCGRCAANAANDRSKMPSCASSLAAGWLSTAPTQQSSSVSE
jgi:acetyl-CoA acetyltransferase